MAKNTLESLNPDSLVVVHRSGSDLIDKTAKQDTQGVKVADLNIFEKFRDAAPTDDGGQNYPNAKQGEVFCVVGASGKVNKYICGGSYGESLAFEQIITGAITQNSAITAQGSDTTIGLAKIAHSGSASGTLTLKYQSSSSAITKLKVVTTDSGFKVGDTITITGLAGQAQDIIVTLREVDLNVGIWAEEAFATIESGEFTPS